MLLTQFLSPIQFIRHSLTELLWHPHVTFAVRSVRHRMSVPPLKAHTCWHNTAGAWNRPVDRDAQEGGRWLVRIHFIIVMIRWTGLAPWEFEFPFPGSLTSTFLVSSGGRGCEVAHGDGAVLLQIDGVEHQIEQLPADSLSCQPTPYPANRHPILPTDALSCQPTPYPANRHPILPTDVLS